MKVIDKVRVLDGIKGGQVFLEINKDGYLEIRTVGKVQMDFEKADDLQFTIRTWCRICKLPGIEPPAPDGGGE